MTAIERMEKWLARGLSRAISIKGSLDRDRPYYRVSARGMIPCTDDRRVFDLSKAINSDLETAIGELMDNVAVQSDA